MARRRIPKLKAEIEGRNLNNPKRFKDRKEPKAGAEVGDPPDYLDEDNVKAWAMFRKELPWLNESHRAILEIACTVRSRIIAGEVVGIQALNLLRQCLGQLGATPADATKVTVADEEESDPADKYLD